MSNLPRPDLVPGFQYNEVEELGDDFFQKAILTKPGESIIMNMLQQENLEQARLLGMSGEREARLLAIIDHYERTLMNIRDSTHTSAVVLRGWANIALSKTK